MADRGAVLAVLLDELMNDNIINYQSQMIQSMIEIQHGNTVACTLALGFEEEALRLAQAGASHVGDYNVSPQKRKSTDSSEDASAAKKTNTTSNEVKKPVAGKITMSLGGVTKKPGITMNLAAKKTNPAPIKLALSAPSKDPPVLPKAKVAAVFNDDSDSEEEEMPMEAKMRMRNVGRETPTASGPNSFGKGNLGFCDRTKMIEKDLKKQMEDFGDKADGLK